MTKSIGEFGPITVDRLTKRDFADLRRRHRALGGLHAAMVVAARNPALLAAYEVLAGAIAADALRFEELIEHLSPETPHSRAAVLQARRNAEARADLIRDYGLTSEEVAGLAGSRAGNRAALANRWKKEGRVFSVTYGGTAYFPSFQLDEAGRPLPVIAELLALWKDRDYSEWEIALWFLAPNGWLDGARPADLLSTGPERVLDAARREQDTGVF